ncbi:MAG: ester cyclase [Pseudomonadota bacterium]
MSDLIVQKQRLRTLLTDLAAGADPADIYTDTARLHGAHPINQCTGPAEIGTVWRALRTSLPDLERRDLIAVGGKNGPDDRVTGSRPDTVFATMGHLLGTFEEPLFGIPPTGGAVMLRHCEAHVLTPDGISETWFLPDFLDLMRQAGVFPLSHALGADFTWPGPNIDGCRWHLGEPGNTSIDLVLKMHAALQSFDGRDLESMPHAAYWTDNFMWYGPGGIGTSRGLSGFRQHHQIPFLTAFPDRAGAGHYMRLSDGDFAVTGGWPSVRGTHLGPWLGMPATGTPVDMRVMDFYRIENGRIAENWVPLDVIHVALQLGVDLFARMHELQGKRRTTL